MQRSLVAAAIVSTTIACGGFLGFGDDDETPIAPSGPTNGADASDSSSNAEGGSTADGGCTPVALKLSSRGSDLPAILDADGWQATTTGTTTLDLVNERLVASSQGGGRGDEEAYVSRRIPGKIAAVSCNVKSVMTSTLDGEGRFAELRFTGPAWNGSYSFTAIWLNGDVSAAAEAMAVGATVPQDATSLSVKTSVKENAPFDLALGFDAKDPPTGKVTYAGFGISMEGFTPAAFDAVTIVVGIRTKATSTTPAYDVQYGDVACNVCLAP